MEQTRKKKTSKPYSSEFRERAVRLVMEHRDDYQSEAAALSAIAGKLGCSPDSLRTWVRQIQRDGGERPGPRVRNRTCSTLCRKAEGVLLAVSLDPWRLLMFCF